MKLARLYAETSIIRVILRMCDVIISHDNATELLDDFKGRANLLQNKNYTKETIGILFRV